MLEAGDPVLVHCSDGWDRTSQICSLAQLLLGESVLLSVLLLYISVLVYCCCASGYCTAVHHEVYNMRGEQFLHLVDFSAYFSLTERCCRCGVASCKRNADVPLQQKYGSGGLHALLTHQLHTHSGLTSHQHHLMPLSTKKLKT